MEPLLDPQEDREMKDIVPPPHKPLSDELLYPNKGNSFGSLVLNNSRFSNA